MSETLLRTKTFVPPLRPNLVPRFPLINRLNQGLHQGSKLTLISAPAGFGKTTLIIEWISQSLIDICAWLSLDENDNDPIRFLTYFVASLQTSKKEENASSGLGGTALALLQSPQTRPLESIMAVLINELAAAPGRFVVVLDDYHVIESQAVHDILVFLLDQLPQQLHVVIVSRSDPPLPFARLRIRGELTEMRMPDLRFTYREISTLFNQVLNLSLSGEDIASLDVRTEGWIAGLQAAALSMRELEDVSSFIKAFTGSHRFVFDYLADEVLSQLTEELRQFLLRTSVLDQLTASLCDKLTARNDSALILKELEKDNLFLIPLDDRREWYRYHQLFRDYLLSELPEEQKAGLYTRAADWFGVRRIYNESVKYALVSADLERAAEIMSQAIPEFFNRGYLLVISEWLKILPKEIVSGNDVLAVYKGFVLYFANSYAEAGSYAEAAKQLNALGAPASLQGRLRSLQAHLALCEGEIDDCIRFSRDALEYLDEEDITLRNLTQNVLAQVLETKGDLVSAVGIYREILKSKLQPENLGAQLVIFANLVFSLNELGSRREALALCKQLATEFSANNLPLMAALDLPWSLLSLEANELELAQKQALHALELLSSMNFKQGTLWAQYILAQVHLARDEFEAMYELTHAGFLLAPKGGQEAPQASWFAALEALANLQQGEIIHVDHWARSSNFAPSDRPSYRLEYPYLTYVRLLLAQDRLDDAHAVLRAMEASAQQGERTRKLITINLLNARLKLIRQEEDHALEYARQAVILAAPEDYRRAFLNEGPEIVRLLPKLRALAPTFVEDLLASSGVDSTAPMARPPDALSERELAILQLVAQGLSNREIAELSFVQVGTVKKHLYNVFGKLQVKSRTQAVVRGRELGLLE